MKRKVLCYGASTTWGYEPGSGSRFPKTVRWPCVLKSSSVAPLEVIEEGYSGRSVLDHLPYDHPTNGFHYLEKLLDKISSDITILFLGTNDLFADREIPVRKVASGIERMIHCIKFKNPYSDIIVMAPPKLNGDFEEAYLYQSEIEKSGHFSAEYKHIAAINMCHFADSGRIVVPSSIDGIHFDGEDHIKLGRYMADFIGQMPL